MEDTYGLVVNTDKEHARILINHFVPDLTPCYERLLSSDNWRFCGLMQIREVGVTQGYLYAPKSGLLEISLGEGGLAKSMKFSAVEKPTLIEMAGDIGLTEIQEGCIRKPLTNYKKD